LKTQSNPIKPRNQFINQDKKQSIQRGKKNLHIEELGVTNKGIPTKRPIKVNISFHMSFLTRHPRENHHYPFSIHFPSPPITLTSKSPHFFLPPPETAFQLFINGL
jgi:hypothetical protein